MINKPKISVIVPVLNEEDWVPALCTAIKENSDSYPDLELLFVDGGSTDSTAKQIRDSGGRVISSPKGRARQMNTGAREAKGDILYFLHADTLPPNGFDKAIREAVGAGRDAGCFRMKFESPSRFLAFFSWFTRVNHWLCRGGDQSLFITRDRFEALSGFNEDYIIYEDLELIRRLYKKGGFTVLPGCVITSARKYQRVGKWKLQYHFTVIHLKNYLGASPEALYQYYKRHIETANY